MNTYGKLEKERTKARIEIKGTGEILCPQQYNMSHLYMVLSSCFS